MTHSVWFAVCDLFPNLMYYLNDPYSKKPAFLLWFLSIQSPTFSIKEMEGEKKRKTSLFPIWISFVLFETFFSLLHLINVINFRGISPNLDKMREREKMFERTFDSIFVLKQVSLEHTYVHVINLNPNMKYISSPENHYLLTRGKSYIQLLFL